MLGALGGATCACLGMLGAWGFSVDDALIVTRVAHHLAVGVGYRFNADGPSVDCVTPLGFAQLLAPFAHAGAWQGLLASRLLGSGCWLLAAACIGAWSAHIGSGPRRLIAPLVLGTCLPLSAWASSGLETGLVLLLATLALLPLRTPVRVAVLGGAAAGGLAAALRPELTPWAVALASCGAWARRERLIDGSLDMALALVPPVAVAVVRELLFGRPAPLAVFAKPSDFEHGLRYALGALALSGPLWLLASTHYRRLEPRYWAIGVAALVHWVVLVGVGGDWMPLWRLALPTFPSLLLLATALAEQGSPRANLLRALVVIAVSLLLHWGKGADARGVVAQRARLIAELRPWLDGARRIATVDVGWVGAASERSVVDLAGVTDEDVALLPGGHTSKRLPESFLVRREVDTLVLLDEPREAQAPPPPADAPPRPWRAVERRLLTLDGAASFHVVARLPLTPTQDYVVLRRSP